MAEVHNEIGGGHFHGPVVQAGRVDRLVLGSTEDDRPTHPPLTSWRGRPSPTPALVDLLEAQREATESLPYRLLGMRRQPELTRVYVQQRIRPQDVDATAEADRKGAAPRKQAERAERAVPLTEVLDGDRHLVVVGEPGAGKSTLCHLHTQRICDHWLDGADGPPPLAEPVLPLRVPARALAADAPWGELLAEGAQEALGSLLTHRPRPSLLGRRALGARWLVFVDGLDEITDRDARAQVIRAVAARMRRAADHRLVVTTRPLDDAELAPFEQNGVDTYVLQPFGAVELDEFAAGWFRAQDPATYRARAEEFTRQVRDGRLRELVRNPLLATIAAIAKTLEPERGLPGTTTELYGRFMDHLLADSASGRRTLPQLRRSLRDRPARLALAEWVEERRVEIVEHLAATRLAGDAPLFDAACAWVAQRRDELPSGWREDLRAVLAGCGVFVRAETTLRFLHHSFAEFLAARAHARRIGPDFPGVGPWIARGLHPATESYASFTFALWGRDHDIGPVLRELLDCDRGRVLLAGRLLAEDVPVADDLVAAVVDRLVDLLLAHGMLTRGFDAEQHEEVQEVGRVLAALGPRSGSLVGRLTRLRDDPDVGVSVRVECAVALGRLADPVAAADWLERAVGDLDPPAVLHAMTGLVEVDPRGIDRAERLLARLGDAGPDYVVTAAAIVILLELDRTAAAAALVGDLVGRLRADLGEEPALPAPPTRAADHPGSLRVVDSWDDTPFTWSVVARLAERAGRPAEAAWAARRELAGDPDTDTFPEAAATLLRTGGDGAVAEVLAVVARRPPAFALAAADAFQEAQLPDEAAALALSRLGSPTAAPWELTRAAVLLLDCGVPVDDVVRPFLADAVSPLEPAFVDFAHRLAVEGHPGQACLLARRTVADPSAGLYPFWRAAKVLVDFGGEGSAEEVHRLVLDRPPVQRAQVASALHDAGRVDLTDDLVDGLLDERAPVEVLTELVSDLAADAPGSPAVGRLLDAALPEAGSCGPRDLHDLASALAASGRAGEAVPLARRALLAALREEGSLRSFVDKWLDLAGAAVVEEVVGEVLSRDLKAGTRMDVADAMAARGLLGPAASLWLDVARHHGEAVDHGVNAALRLVRAGRRAQVLAAVRDELAEPRSSGATRSRLRALLAWIEGF